MSTPLPRLRAANNIPGVQKLALQSLQCLVDLKPTKEVLVDTRAKVHQLFLPLEAALGPAPAPWSIPRKDGASTPAAMARLRNKTEGAGAASAARAQRTSSTAEDEVCAQRETSAAEALAIFTRNVESQTSFRRTSSHTPQETAPQANESADSATKPSRDLDAAPVAAAQVPGVQLRDLKEVMEDLQRARGALADAVRTYADREAALDSEAARFAEGCRSRCHSQT